MFHKTRIVCSLNFYFHFSSLNVCSLLTFSVSQLNLIACLPACLLVDHSRPPANTILLRNIHFISAGSCLLIVFYSKLQTFSLYSSFHFIHFCVSIRFVSICFVYKQNHMHFAAFSIQSNHRLE